MYTLTFGKYQGQTLNEVYRNDPQYVQWLADKSYNVTARHAAQAIIDAVLDQDAEVKSTILRDLANISRSKKRKRGGIASYRYVDIFVHEKQVEITFADKDCFTDGGWSDEDQRYTDANIIRIATGYDGEDSDYNEIFVTQVPDDTAPTSEMQTWYCWSRITDDPLTIVPLPLAQAVDYLDDYLQKKEA